MTSPAVAPSSVWLSAAAAHEMRGDAQRHAPAETGGVLVGYRADDSIVVTTIVGGGALAVRTPERFSPDAAYQAARVAELYESSGRLDTYLGDWHSHPSGMLAVSRTDRRTIRRISREKDARCEVPVMIVVGGRGDDGEACWDLAAWVFDATQRHRLAEVAVRIHRPTAHDVHSSRPLRDRRYRARP